MKIGTSLLISLVLLPATLSASWRKPCVLSYDGAFTFFDNNRRIYRVNVLLEPQKE